MNYQNFTVRLLPASIFAVLIIAGACRNKSSDKEGWTNLFDGKTWKVFDFQNSMMPDDEVTCMKYFNNTFCWIYSNYHF